MHITGVYGSLGEDTHTMGGEGTFIRRRTGTWANLDDCYRCLWSFTVEQNGQEALRLRSIHRTILLQEMAGAKIL